MLLTPDNEDFLNAHSLSHSDNIDEYQVKRLVGTIIKCSTRMRNAAATVTTNRTATSFTSNSNSFESDVIASNMIDISLQKEKLSKALDLPTAVIETIMCRMALRSWVSKSM